MKKMFGLSLLLLSILVINFTSCSQSPDVAPPTPPTPPPPITNDSVVKETIIPLSSTYYAKRAIEGKLIYMMSFGSANAFDESDMIKDAGMLYRFILVVATEPTKPTDNPPMGTYKFSNSGDGMTILTKDEYGETLSYCSGFNADGNADSYDIISFKDGGELIIEADKITIKVTTEASEHSKEVTYELTCVRPLITKYVLDLPYEKYEPNTPTNKEVTFTNAVFLNKKDAYRIGNSVIDASFTNEGDNTHKANIIFFLNQNATTIQTGTYPINGSSDIGTVFKSTGSTAGDAYTFLGENESMYFIVSGDVVIGDNSFTLQGKSYFGSDIKFAYQGAMDLVETTPVIKK